MKLLLQIHHFAFWIPTLWQSKKCFSHQRKCYQLYRLHPYMVGLGIRKPFLIHKQQLLYFLHMHVIYYFKVEKATFQSTLAWSIINVTIWENMFNSQITLYFPNLYPNINVVKWCKRRRKTARQRKNIWL